MAPRYNTVEDVIARTRRKFTLHGIDPMHDIEIGGRRVHTGTGGAAPVILRVLRGEPPAPEMHIEGGPFDAAGLVSFILDGKDRGGGPAAPGRTGTIDTIVLEPDDITLGLSRQMKKAASLSIEVPSSRGAETIEFGLDGYGAALERVQKSAD